MIEHHAIFLTFATSHAVQTTGIYFNVMLMQLSTSLAWNHQNKYLERQYNFTIVQTPFLSCTEAEFSRSTLIHWISRYVRNIENTLELDGGEAMFDAYIQNTTERAELTVQQVLPCAKNIPWTQDKLFQLVLVSLILNKIRPFLVKIHSKIKANQIIFYIKVGTFIYFHKNLVQALEICSNYWSFVATLIGLV